MVDETTTTTEANVRERERKRAHIVYSFIHSLLFVCNRSLYAFTRSTRLAARPSPPSPSHLSLPSRPHTDASPSRHARVVVVVRERACARVRAVATRARVSHASRDDDATIRARARRG